MTDDVGARHNVHVLGSGPSTLVLGHGLGTDQSIWRALAPRLAVDHRVVLLDWVGSGRADPAAFRAARYASLRGHADDLAQLVGWLGGGPVSYVGHSAGGMIGVLSALSAPHAFHGLVLLAASPCYLEDPPDYHGGLRPADVEGLLSLLDENLVGWASTVAGIAAKEPALQRELTQLLAHNEPEHLREFASAVLRSDFRGELSKLRLPALVIGATHDDMVPLSVSEYLHARLQGSSYVGLDLAGHCPQLTHPEAVEGAIRGYLHARGG